MPLLRFVGPPSYDTRFELLSPEPEVTLECDQHDSFADTILRFFEVWRGVNLASSATELRFLLHGVRRTITPASEVTLADLDIQEDGDVIEVMWGLPEPQHVSPAFRYREAPLEAPSLISEGVSAIVLGMRANYRSWNLNGVMATLGLKVCQVIGCRALANLALSNEGIDAALSVKGTVVAVVEAMRRLGSDMDVQRHGCRALGNLASSGSRDVLAVEGSVAAVVAALQGHPSEVVQQHGCRALARLARSKEGQQAVLAVDGSVAALVAAVAGSADDDVQDQGCRALGYLAESAEGTQAVLAVEGSVAAVVAAMIRQEEDDDVQRSGCLALSNLVMKVSDEGEQAVLGVDGSIAAILKAMAGHATDTEVQRHGCRALPNLAVSEEGERAVLAVEGAVAAVVTAMVGHAASADVQREGCCALANLAVSEEGERAVLAVEGAVAAVVAALTGHATDADVQYQGCDALANLTASEEGKVAVVAVEGAVVAVVAALAGHENEDVQHLSCLALANLAENEVGRQAVMAVTGSVAALEAAMGSSDGEVQSQARDALANLKQSEEGRDAVLAAESAASSSSDPSTPEAHEPGPSDDSSKRPRSPAGDNTADAKKQCVSLVIADQQQQQLPTLNDQLPDASEQLQQTAQQHLGLLQQQLAQQQQTALQMAQQLSALAAVQQQQAAQTNAQQQLQAELDAERGRRAEAESRVTAVQQQEETRIAASKQQEDELLMVRYMALRQHFECLRMAARAGTATWNFKLARGSLVSGVLEHFQKLSMGANLSGPVQLWRNTRVAFEGEAGVDEGGPTAEMHALFWVEVCKPAHGLFEQREGDGRYLPKRGAPPEQLESVGRVLLKSIVDDHPTGPQLARFLFLFLRGRCCLEPQGATDARAHEALHTLADFAPGLAKQWREHALEASADQLARDELTLDMFDETLGEGAVTRDNVAAAVVAGCRRVLLEGREEELKALERGFTFSGKVDLALQLAPIPAEQLLLMVRGKDELSAEDLLGCFKWPAADEATAGAAAHLRTVIVGRLDQKSRRLLLRWCTARSTLPVDGLKEKVTIELLLPEAPLGPDGYFPRSHTCYPSIELPAYSSADVLLQQLQLALVDLEHGGGFGLE